eukprot:scaffold10.g2271.t1
MKNLVVVQDRRFDLQLPLEYGEAVEFAVDNESGQLLAIGSELGVASYRLADGQASERGDAGPLWTADLRAMGADLPPAPGIAAFLHAPELAATLVALTSGELLLLRGGGGTGAAARPELEEEWELVAEVPLLSYRHDTPAAAAASAAAAAQRRGGAAPHSTERREEGEGDEEEEEVHLGAGDVAITWRGDGLFFATVSRDSPREWRHGEWTRARASAATVRVWDRDACELHSVGEAAPGLLPAAAWQPNGRHLYVAQLTQQEHQEGGAEAGAPAAPGGGSAAAGEDEAAVRHVGAWKRELRRRQEAAAAAGGQRHAAAVLLYERNGLQHGEFAVPTPADAPAGTGSAVPGGAAPGGSGAAANGLQLNGGGGGAGIAQLAWSSDSELLAVVVAATDADGLPLALLQLWHRSNWHWYLKLERQFSGCARLRCAWDAEAPLLLHATTAEGDYERLLLSRQPSASALGTAVVVDGRRLLITPLRLCCVPPPMAAAQAALPAPAACVAVRNGIGREAIATVLSDGRLALLESAEGDQWEDALDAQLEEAPWDRPGPPCLLPRVLALASPALEAAAGGAAVRQAVWLGADRLLLLAAAAPLCELNAGSGGASGGSCADVLVELALNPATGVAEEVAACACAPVLALAPAPAPAREAAPLAAAAGKEAAAAPRALVQGHSGALLAYESGGQLADAGPEAGFPVPCPRMALAPPPAAVPAPEVVNLWHGIGGAAVEAPPAAAAFGLSERGQLFLGARQLAADATSFAVRTGGCGVILQMPRGNLELVQPRSLVVPAIASALDAGDYASAWALATTNRCDLNLLVDHAWPAFLAAAPAFVAQASGRCVPGDQDIADLLSALTDGPSTIAPGGVYAAALPASSRGGDGVSDAVATGAPGTGEGEGPPPTEGKVAAVCAAVREALMEGGQPTRLRAVLTSHAKCGDLEGALALIKQRKEAELEQQEREQRTGWQRQPPPGESPVPAGAGAGADGGEEEKGEDADGFGFRLRDPGRPATAEEGLRHLLLFVHEDTLYRAALGMYELELALMVVMHSQRDPGEHAIDCHLGRWERALAHLLAAGPAKHDAALALAKDKGLLRQLLALCQKSGAPSAAAGPAAAVAAQDSGQQEGQREVQGRERAVEQGPGALAALRLRALEAYAEALEAKNMPEDAGLAYLAAGLPERAVAAYAAAGEWRIALALAGRRGWEPGRQRRLAEQCVAELQHLAQPAEAAAVAHAYLQAGLDTDAAVALLAGAGEWREAVRLAYQAGRPDLVETVVAPAAAAAAAATLEEARENLERVRKYWARLRELRQRRAAIAAAVAAEDAGAGARDADDDLTSEATSQLSALSIYTDATHTALPGSSALGSTLASTVGGKRRKSGRPRKSKSNVRVRQGSPQEEKMLGEHLLGLAPTGAAFAQAGQLAELLVLLGHEADAALLQRQLAALIAEQSAAAADVLAHPPPGAGLALPQEAAAELAARAGPAAAAAAAATVAAALPSPELAARAAAAEAGVKEARWKWDLLRAV